MPVARDQTLRPKLILRICVVWVQHSSVLKRDKRARLDDFSDYLGLSRFHFSRRFRSITGMPPMKYFMHLKIKKAYFLLQSTSLKIKAISHDLGFENEYYSSRCFKTSVAARRSTTAKCHGLMHTHATKWKVDFLSLFKIALSV